MMRAADLFADLRVLRELSRRGSIVARGAELVALQRWRDNYGAAKQNAKGEWRLCYQPQWISDAKMRMANAVVAEQTASTNDEAAAMKPPVFVFADYQTAGRGRGGRVWLSLPGAAVLFSAHLHLPMTMTTKAAGLTVAIGAGLWRVLKQYAAIQLKWPNDLLDARGRKIGGVLAAAKGESVVIGVGINLHITAQMAARIKQPAAGLADIAGNGLPPLALLAQNLAESVRQTCLQFAADGMRPFLPEALGAHYRQVGEAITINNGIGAKDKSNSGGIFAGFADDGALLLKNGGNINRHLCGEVA